MFGELVKCLKRGPKVIEVPTFDSVCDLVPVEFGVVWDDNRPVGAEQRVVFNDYQSRGTSCYGLPDPVVVAVNVDAQQVDFTFAAAVTNKIIDVLAGSPIGKTSDPQWCKTHR